MNIEIRNTLAKDAQQVCDLLEEQGYQSDFPNFALYFWTDANNHASWVALEGEKVVGFISVHLWDKIWRKRNLAAYIEDLVVARDYRHLGIGRKLMNTAIGYAKNAGCYKVMATPAPNNTEFFERCGLEQNLVEMRINFQ